MKNKVIAGIIGSLISLILNFAFIHHMIIPDECYYHSHRPNVVMELFYDFNANNGYHPSVSLFNLVFTISIGVLVGVSFVRLVSNFYSKKYKVWSEESQLFL